jgi:hypothetical protein
MKFRLESRILILVAALAAGSCVPLVAQSYTFEAATCGDNFFPYGMNGSGAVVGTTTVNGTGSGAIYYNGKCYTYPTVYFSGVSDTGWLIGYPPGTRNNAEYLIQPGKVSPLPNPFGLTSNFTYCCIDSATGTLAGNYYPSNGALESGFFYQSGKFTSLPSGYTIGALNNTGIAVGETYQGAGIAGFVLAKGKVTLLAYPKAVSTYFYGINDKGIVVGSADANGGTVFTYNLTTGAWTDLNFPYPYNIMNPVGITNSGVIALSGVGGGGLVLATPNP